MTFFRSAFYTPEASGEAFRDFDYDRLSLDLASLTTTWDLEGKIEKKALLDLGSVTDGNGSFFPELSCTLSLVNPRNDSWGELVVDQGETRLLLTFPVHSRGNTEVNGEGISYLRFRYLDGYFYWESSRDSSTHTLAQEKVTLMLAPDGVDDSDWRTPYRTQPHLINEMRRLIPFVGNGLTPAQDSSYSSDRIIAVTILVMPGVYDSWFFHYLDKYGIEVIGAGDSPGDVVVYGNDKNTGIKIAYCNTITIKNLTISSNQQCGYIIGSQDILFENCELICRKTFWPTSALFCTRNSWLRVNGEIGLQNPVYGDVGDIGFFVSSTYASIANISCNLSSPDNLSFWGTGAFLKATFASIIDAGKLTTGNTLEGAAASVSQDGKIYMPAELINNLTYD